jgi:hypothetical protein
MFWIRLAIAFVTCLPLMGQNPRKVIIAAGRAPVLQLIDPATLDTLARIHFDFPDGSAGFSGVWTSADGAKLYADGPLPSDPKGCCVLYSVDLATMKARVAASIYGSSSREQFVFSDGLVFLASSLPITRPIPALDNCFLHVSPDGRWLFGVRSFQDSALEVFDLATGKLVRELKPLGSNGERATSGAWAGGNFYFYVESADGSGRLWKVSPGTTELGPGLAIEEFGQSPGCTEPAFIDFVAAGDTMVFYEPFGFIADRRPKCQVPIPGGAWMVDPATGRLGNHIGPEAHLSTVVADPTGAFLYGLACECRNFNGSGRLLRIDVKDGRVIRSRPIEPGFFRMRVATIRSVPAGDVFAVQER